jgi:hypothetical protein
MNSYRKQRLVVSNSAAPMLCNLFSEVKGGYSSTLRYPIAVKGVMHHVPIPIQAWK